MEKNFKSVLEFSSLQEGYDFCRKNGPNPFIVRNCPDFISATHLEITSQMKLETEIHGYNQSGTHKVRGRDAYNTWVDDTLDFNIVDSCSSRGCLLLPKVLKDLNIANEVEAMVWFSYVLTLAAVQSKVHIDPPFGSGWQYLSQGSKCWTIVDSEFFGTDEDTSANVESAAPLLVSVAAAFPETDPVPKTKVAVFQVVKTGRFSVAELFVSVVLAAVHIDTIVVEDVLNVLVVSEEVAVVVPILSNPDTSIQPKDSPVAERRKFPTKYKSTRDYDLDTMAAEYPQELYRVVLNASDFLSCPVDWPHSVYTIDKTCGLSGYMKYAKSE